MIVDDHSMVRRGIATILKVKPGLELVGEAGNGVEALQLCEQVRPDVILMDLVMPEMDGAAATHAIRASFPDIQVIALTSFKDKELVQGALEAGAIGYLLKNISADELTDAIRSAYAGRPTVAPEAAQVLIQAEKLEQLTRALIDAPSDASSLPELLKRHVPDLLPESWVEIRLFPDKTLLRHPAGKPPVPSHVWEWLHTAVTSHCFVPGNSLPWGGEQPCGEGLILSPLSTAEGPEPLGGIYVSRQREPGTIADHLPIVKTLAAHVASAVHSAEVSAQTRVQRRIARELALAGQIQASFLPSDLPILEGWQVAAMMQPAREIAGDFYDLISFPDGRLGLVVADVADKGMGAALYMALSRTLIRTYAAEYPARPDLVLSATSSRILSDAHAGLFVTAFYGILDPRTGTLTYCNAGHNPPIILDPAGTIQALSRTGMALGVLEDVAWTQASTQLERGAVLVLFTDGIVDAQDQEGKAYGRTQWLELLRAAVLTPGPDRHSAQDLQDALLNRLHRFMGDVPQADDMTLVILVREP
jgi:serine phosphatase RsbU (regulator of sigma subunit)/DNA-binding NarL/FixJ family response regulator